MSDTVRGYRVQGRVQGVGFRWWVRREAERLGLRGDVRNEMDGSVTVVFAGEGAAVDSMESRLAQGPPMSRVDELVPLPEEAIHGRGLGPDFRILR